MMKNIKATLKSIIKPVCVRKSPSTCQHNEAAWKGPFKHLSAQRGQPGQFLKYLKVQCGRVLRSLRICLPNEAAPSGLQYLEAQWGSLEGPEILVSTMRQTERSSSTCQHNEATWTGPCKHEDSSYLSFIYRSVFWTKFSFTTHFWLTVNKYWIEISCNDRLNILKLVFHQLT